MGDLPPLADLIDLAMGEPLPSRELVQSWIDHAGRLAGHPGSIDEWTIAAAYASGELKTEVEWRDTIDWKALRLAIAPLIRADRNTMTLRQATDAALNVVAAALGGTDDG